MYSNQWTVPLSVVKLLIGFFSHTNAEPEKDALDNWICEDDANMKVFEECLKINLRPVVYDLHNEYLDFEFKEPIQLN